ncbi:MAG: ABC transporter ATP-binding protein [Bacilli bacterium]|nr:ABC transporter ATP-binding protein [Bacilli bacterium]
MSKVIEIKNLSKTYKTKTREVQALRDVSVDFESGKFYAIMGHSGSGKSTLISIIGLLESFETGEYKINEKDVRGLKNHEEAELRRDSIGFIFQEFFLDEHLKAYENVIMPMLINERIKKEDRKKRAIELLDLVDLSERVEHFPKEMSGGEKQRVAIARALANDPKVILADEPTGDLDEENEEKIFKILKELSQEGKCVIVVSHSNEVKKYADEILTIEKGKLSKEK